MMSYSEMRQLAKLIVEEQANSEAWMAAFAKANSKLQKKDDKLLSAKEAADMLGISVSLLYHIKDYEDGRPRFSYIKCGKSKSATLKFKASTLVEEYERYVASLNKVIKMSPLKTGTG